VTTSTSAPDHLRDAADLTEEIARQIFGERAYLKTRPHRDRESGDEETLFEVHYGFEHAAANFERLTKLHAAFMNAFATRLDPEALGEIVLTVGPTDDDQSTV